MIEKKDIKSYEPSGNISAPKDESRLAKECKAHVTGDNKLDHYMPKAGMKPKLGPRTSG